MFTSICLVILTLVFVGGLVGVLVGPSKAKPMSGLVGIVALVLALIWGGFACTTQVSTRNVGIITTFGRPGAELSNGIHLVAPWQSVTEMDASIQQENFTGDQALTVRLANNSTARADAQIQWRIVDKAASSLFLDYKDFANVRDQLVNKELNVALNTAFATFDPLIGGTAPTTPPATPAPADGQNLVAISSKVQLLVQKAVGDRIEVQKVFVPLVSYDQSTQDKINNLNIEKTNTAIATQREQTASADAAANNTLSASVDNNPNVLVSKCLDAAAKANASPVGCWPGSVGTAIPVVQLPAK